MSHFVRRAVNPKRPKVEPIHNPTLFEMEKLEEGRNLQAAPQLSVRFLYPEFFSALRRLLRRDGKVPSIHGACSHGISCPCIMQLATI